MRERTETNPADESDFEDAVPVASRSLFAIGFGWWLLLSVLVLVTLAIGSLVTISRIQSGQWVASMPIRYKDVSLLPSARINPAGAEERLLLYFIAGGQRLVAVERKLPESAGDSASERAQLVVRELLRPEGDGAMRSPLPAGTEIRGVYLHEGLALVDLSDAFTDPAAVRDAQQARLRIFGLVNSLMLNNLGLQGVRILVEGEPVDSPWGWLDLSSPLGVDLSLVQ